MTSEEFPLQARVGGTVLLPLLPLELSNKTAKVRELGLVDTGSAINVLPYRTGFELGLVWEEQTKSVPLTGVLRDVEARAVLLQAKIGSLPVVSLVFAWSRTDIPLILGHVNFFHAFDFSMSRSLGVFSISVPARHSKED